MKTRKYYFYKWLTGSYLVSDIFMTYNMDDIIRRSKKDEIVYGEFNSYDEAEEARECVLNEKEQWI